MNTLPLRQARYTSKPQRPPFDKAGQSQTTIDIYLKPIAKSKHSQNDIRNNFPPVTTINAIPGGSSRDSSSSAKIPSTPERSYNDNGAAKCQTPGPNPSLKSPMQSRGYVTESRESEKTVPSLPVGIRYHKHVKSAVLPRFDPFFDSEEFSHSTSPMAPRATDVVRYSLVPKPLTIKMPPPSAVTSRSPSQTTSSPSSVGDPDTASLDGEERREAPSFKQTYLSVHSRHDANDSPGNSLAALRDPSPKQLRQHMRRLATLRSRTLPQLSEPNSSESVIYFLPKISPVSDSSADEQEPLMRNSYQKPIDKGSIGDTYKAKRQARKLQHFGPVQIEGRIDSLKEKAVTVSPGSRSRSTLTLEFRY